MKAWEFMIGIIEEAGAHSNVDIGNVGAMDQQELNACIKRWHARSSGNMHIKSSPNWDIGKAVAFAESIGYKGLYAIEVQRVRGTAHGLQPDSGEYCVSLGLARPERHRRREACILSEEDASDARVTHESEARGWGPDAD